MRGMAHLRTDVQGGVAVQGRKPYGWGDDRLAAFLNLASDNVLGTFAQRRDEYDRLRRIDDAFVDFTDNLLNPQDPIAPLLMLQAHASYRAAAELAMTCQSAPAFMAMRGCVESSLYGFYFHRNPNTFEMWARRHNDDAARQAVRAEFTIRRLKDCLTAVDPATANVVADLYDKTIDFGAHPNVAALAGAFRAENNDQRRQFKVIYLTADLAMIRGTMKSVAQTGVASLLIFRNVFTERFALLGITERLNELRRGL
jgi:hypothetical protein